MYHAEREIRDHDIIKAILDMCDIINIGFFDDEYPYVLPVTFQKGVKACKAITSLRFTART